MAFGWKVLLTRGKVMGRVDKSGQKLEFETGSSERSSREVCNAESESLERNSLQSKIKKIRKI